MAKFLRDLLDAEQPLFSASLRQLESASGQTGADVKLIGTIHELAHDRMRQMKLDPSDTTGKELYQALMNRVSLDNKRLAALIGGVDGEDVKSMIPLMVTAANKVDFPRKVFVLKHSKAKSLLKKMPPKNLMKTLGYSSLTELFKHEDFDELYTALRFSEGPEWLNEYDELFKTVTAADYEERDIRIGVIVVVPMKAERMRGLALKSLPLMLHYLNEIKLYSTFFKMKSKKANFGKTIVTTLIADPGNASQIVDNHIHWRVIQRYFGKLKDESHPEAFEPHVQPEDLHWRRAEDLLFQIDPELVFWKDLDYVALNHDGFPVSFNLFDISFAYSNTEPYERRYAYHFRESLWNEIFIRYMGFPNLQKQVLQQLDNDMIAPEKLTYAKG